MIRGKTPESLSSSKKKNVRTFSEEKGKK